MKRFVLLFFYFSLLILPLYAKGNQEGSRTSTSPYTGDGGKNISITIKVLTAEGLPASLSNTRVLAYRGLIQNFSKYSSILVRPDLDFDDSSYREVLSGYYDDDDEAGSDLGHLRMTDYLMTGSISQSPLGYRFNLQVVKTAANDKSVAFSYNVPCTYSDLADLSIVNRASLDLLGQMGVKLTDKARTELAGTNAANRAKGKTVMKEAVAAQEAGDTARARSLLNQAAALDVQLAEEAKRRLSEMDKPLAILSAETIPPPAPLPPPRLADFVPTNFVPTPERQVPPPAKTTGNLGNDARARQRAYEIEQENERVRKEIAAENERIRAENARRQAEVDAENRRLQAEVDAENKRRQAEVAAENARRQAKVTAENAARDAHNKGIWLKALADSEDYYRNYLAAVWPVELVYENKLDEYTQNLVNKTISLKFNVALVPVESGWARAVENDVNNLRSQLLATGRAAAWGLANWPQTPIRYPSPFENKSGIITAEAELLDDGGKIMGSQIFFLDWKLTASFSDKGLSFSVNEDDLSSKFVFFENINIYDMTDTLQIRIARINGEDAEKAAAQGIRYSTDYQKWRPVAQRKLRRAAQKTRQEARQTARQAANDGFDRFLRTSGINFMGWGGGEKNTAAGGGEIELRMFHRFSLQTGIYPVAFQEENETIIQLPVLARFNLIYITEEDMRNSGYTARPYLSPYAGIGVNFSSSSPISPIVGFEAGFLGSSFSLFGGGRLQKNVFSDNYGFIWYGGMGYYVPFHKR